MRAGGAVGSLTQHTEFWQEATVAHSVISGLGTSSEHKLLSPEQATARTTPVQQSLVDSAKVGPKFTPSMSTLSWNSIPSIVTGSVHVPTASALDFVGYRRDPVAVQITELPDVS